MMDDIMFYSLTVIGMISAIVCTVEVLDDEGWEDD